MRSMTGYGRQMLARGGREMTVEVKSVNHRFLDIGFRTPRNLAFLEDVARRVLNERLNRGHVDVFINYRNARDDARVVVVDEPLLRAYEQAFGRMAEIAGRKGDVLTLAELSQLPELLRVDACEEDRESVVALFEEALNLALDQLIAMRDVEGASLSQDLLGRLARLAQLRADIAGRAPLVVEEYRQRLQQRIAELLDGPVDPQRLAMEVALMADRAAIDEELARLVSHEEQIVSTLRLDQPVGRKLDFLVQELNRELNTIGSKSSDTQITHWVVDAKSEVEKLREQVQNIE